MTERQVFPSLKDLIKKEELEYNIYFVNLMLSDTAGEFINRKRSDHLLR